jgi:alanyl-tRNA synthetase
MVQCSDDKVLVKPLYMEQASLFTCKAIIKKIGSSEINKKKFQWIQLDQTIFHPKGGGQLHDEGTIGGVQVSFVHKDIFDKSRLDQFEILHCFDENQALSFKEGDEVELIVDASKRMLYSKMHTAGHLLAETTNSIFPDLEGYHGNHDPKDGYVKFKMLKPEISHDKQDIINKVQPCLDARIEQGCRVSVLQLESGLRAIQIGSSSPMPCGGTHIENLKEIGAVEVTDLSINKKDAVITIKYKVPA